VIVVNVAVIGMGLIGGSLLRALAEAGHWAIGYDLDPATRAMARTGAAQAPKGSRWQVAPTIADAVASVELVVVATPLTAVAHVLDEVAGAGFSGLVTDVVSVKEPVRDLVERRLRAGGMRLAGYVGGHPMAGRETAGFAATDPALFRGCAWVLCLDEESSDVAGRSMTESSDVAGRSTTGSSDLAGRSTTGSSEVAGRGMTGSTDVAGRGMGATRLADWLTVARLITGLGARVVPTTSEDHDLAVASVSHVPHLLAAALAVALTDPLAATLAAGSFRDGTRVAASPPELIASMCGGNAGPVLEALETIIEELGGAREALESGDPIAGIRKWVTPANAARTSWPRGWGEPAQIPATVDDLLDLGCEGGWITDVSPDGRTVTAAQPI
jgi:prephenate dehydrogenase